SLRPRSRFARFTNLPELQQMFRAFADVQTPEMLNLPRPELEGGKAQAVACPMSEEQARRARELAARYDRLRSRGEPLPRLLPEPPQVLLHVRGRRQRLVQLQRLLEPSLLILLGVEVLGVLQQQPPRPLEHLLVLHIGR